MNILSVLAVSSRRPSPEPITRVTVRLHPFGSDSDRDSEVRLTESGPGRYSGGAQLPQAGRWRMTVILERAGGRVSAGFAWAVDEPDVARPVAVSARPLAPLLARIAAVAALLGVAVAASTMAARRRPRAPGSVALIEPFSKEAP